MYAISHANPCIPVLPRKGWLHDASLKLGAAYDDNRTVASFMQLDRHCWEADASPLLQVMDTEAREQARQPSAIPITTQIRIPYTR